MPLVCKTLSWTTFLLVMPLFPSPLLLSLPFYLLAWLFRKKRIRFGGCIEDKVAIRGRATAALTRTSHSSSAPVSTTAATSKKKPPKKTTTKASKEPTQPPQGTSSRPAKRMRTRSSAVETTPAQSPALAPQAFAPPPPATVDLVET